MRLLLRVILFFVLVFVALTYIIEVSALVETYWGGACATCALAILLSGWAFLFEFVIAGRRPGWLMAAVLPVGVILRYALWILVGLIINLGPFGPSGVIGPGPNLVVEVIIDTVALGQAYRMMYLVQSRRARVETTELKRGREEKEEKGDKSNKRRDA